jgi:hypothetical protein
MGREREEGGEREKGEFRDLEVMVVAELTGIGILVRLF